MSPRLLTRRTVVHAGVAAAFSGLGDPHARAAEPAVVFLGFGGSLAEAYEKHVFARFTRETGVPVISASGYDMAKIKAQVVSGNVTWDIVSFPGAEGAAAERQGLLEKLDSSIIKPQAPFIASRECCLPFTFYWGGIAYDPRRIPRAKVPGSWRDFWDVERFPGRRALRDRVDETLELALMADGISPRALYPLDVDRAFRSLERIRPHVVKFIRETQQTISLVQTGEVDFSYTTAGRAGAAVLAGLSIAFLPVQPILIPNYLGVLKGSRQKEAAMRLLEYSVKPELQAALANDVPGFGVNSPAALPLLSAQARQVQPDLHSRNTAFADMDWWAEHYSEVSKRWVEWMLNA